MYDSDNSLIFQKSNIAELNSMLLFDYGNSLKKYYNGKKRSHIHSKFFKWFDHSKFDKTNNSFLNDFEDYFYNFVLKSSI
ncbi:MAG: hypothetical protein HWN81_09125 [Candidatus Lokiarchaeota archaeon]|nr:hypothetical protein [Candidatus Lokiarchaeota archaeon]